MLLLTFHFNLTLFRESVRFGASQVAQLVKNLPANAGDTRVAGSISGQQDPLEEEMQPLQYSCLENSMDREAW